MENPALKYRLAETTPSQCDTIRQVRRLRSRPLKPQTARTETGDATAQYGHDYWARLHLERRAGGLLLWGSVPSLDLFARRLGAILVINPHQPLRVRIDEVLAHNAKWRRVLRRLALLRGLPGSATATEINTILLPSDGPCQVLARKGEFRLLRATDGTSGWAKRPRLGSVVLRATKAPSWDGGRLECAARSFLGVPYLRGGTTKRGVDCSGLVQRVYRSIGVVLPRHSTDQRDFGTLRGNGRPNNGDLAFLMHGSEGILHVGLIFLSDRRTSVIHASTSRSTVVEDPLEDLRRKCSRILIVQGPSLFVEYLRLWLAGNVALSLPSRQSPP